MGGAQVQKTIDTQRGLAPIHHQSVMLVEIVLVLVREGGLIRFQVLGHGTKLDPGGLSRSR